MHTFYHFVYFKQRKVILKNEIKDTRLIHNQKSNFDTTLMVDDLTNIHPLMNQVGCATVILYELKIFFVTKMELGTWRT